ncbi:hypothetical protein Cgig2_019944 [Carnegiea gigantea]|uniref:Uncharacterized protein n=1 Tax=Carnegiea gigantea TaxID=171969 RepID=A0A9Q1GVU7_9CARY|nr:hypothetical protein Cgig2_019944 [Carnegiea gigantea]
MSHNLQVPCPRNSILYNQTLCSCSPGYLYNTTTKTCSLFTVSPTDEWVRSSVVKYSSVVQNYQKLIKFQLFYTTTLVVALLVWLLLCALVRLRDLGDGRSIWFWIRWRISRLDVTFSTRHWLPDQTPVRKRETELGGTFSMASWMLFIGLFVALTHQNVSRKGTEVYGMKATNAPDLLSFTNDLQLNVTTISTMTCSQLRGLDTVALGTPGFIDYRLAPLSTFANFSCANSTKGPKIILTIKNCPLSYNHVYISWHFVDTQNAFPASAIGFQFNFTARNRIDDDQEYANFVSGTVKNEKGLEDMRVTYRGEHTNLLRFNLFPRVYLNLDHLELVQPLFHEFRPGSYARDEKHLQSLLQSTEHGFINVTVALNFLSDFLVEIDEQKYGGAVVFLADVGGLYCLSVAFFLLLLFLCESRVKRLRNEDQLMQRIRKRRMAVDRWHKVHQ